MSRGKRWGAGGVAGGGAMPFASAAGGAGDPLEAAGAAGNPLEAAGGVGDPLEAAGGGAVSACAKRSTNPRRTTSSAIRIGFRMNAAV